MLRPSEEKIYHGYCCFCKRAFDWPDSPPRGLSAWPVNDNENARCCSECQKAIVVPGRRYLFTRWETGDVAFDAFYEQYEPCGDVVVPDDELDF